jgi:threonine dehydrogenase-like Zn-dependent dehydrogenase
MINAGSLNRELVLENDAVVGSVNANLRHYRAAAEALAGADPAWLRRLVTREVPLADAPGIFHDTGDAGDDDVKVVIRVAGDPDLPGSG